MIICFIGGVLVGGFLGVALMCLLSVGGDVDCDCKKHKNTKMGTKEQDDVL